MIIEYKDAYLEDIRDLLVELEEYIISIDKDNLDTIHSDYREMVAIKDLDNIKNNKGKCYLYIENGKAIGLVMGILTKYDDYDYLDYKCPKRGEIIELIVTSKIRSNGVGQALMKEMEKYFLSQSCEYILVDVFGYNDNGLKFYYY